MRLIQREGDSPIAEPVGNDGTLMVFNSGLASSDSDHLDPPKPQEQPAALDSRRSPSQRSDQARHRRREHTHLGVRRSHRRHRGCDHPLQRVYRHRRRRSLAVQQRPVRNSPPPLRRRWAGWSRDHGRPPRRDPSADGSAASATRSALPPDAPYGRSNPSAHPSLLRLQPKPRAERATIVCWREVTGETGRRISRPIRRCRWVGRAAWLSTQPWLFQWRRSLRP
jgi:hypothetical protein